MRSLWLYLCKMQVLSAQAACFDSCIVLSVCTEQFATALQKFAFTEWPTLCHTASPSLCWKTLIVSCSFHTASAACFDSYIACAQGKRPVLQDTAPADGWLCGTASANQIWAGQSWDCLAWSEVATLVSRTAEHGWHHRWAHINNSDGSDDADNHDVVGMVMSR